MQPFNSRCSSSESVYIFWRLAIRTVSELPTNGMVQASSTASKNVNVVYDNGVRVCNSAIEQCRGVHTLPLCALDIHDEGSKDTYPQGPQGTLIDWGQTITTRDKRPELVLAHFHTMRICARDHAKNDAAYACKCVQELCIKFV